MFTGSESEVDDGDDDGDPAAGDGRTGIWMPIMGEDPGPTDVPFTGNAGPVHAPPGDTASPLDYVKLFIDQQFVQNIVVETNRYADTWIQQNDDYLRRHPRSRVHDWIKQGKTAVEEIYAFLAVTINMGLNRKPTLYGYWSNRPSQAQPWFTDHFSRDRYTLLLKFLHFNDNANMPDPQDPQFKIYKILPVLLDLNRKFLRFYNPGEHISIDESMVGYKGKTPHLRQYMPNKHHARFGVKLWCLCDSVSSYTSQFEVFKGAADPRDRQAEGMTYTLVMRLMEKSNLFHRGHHLGLDNFFTSPALLYDLYSQNTTATGTVRKNRKGLPKSVTNAKIQNKNVVERRRGNLLCVGYKDGSKQPTLLSTKSKAGFCTSTNSKGKEKRLPKVVALYNKSMGGVDMSDSRLYCYLSERRTMKWTTKVFFSLLGRCVLNAYIIYKDNPSTVRKTTRYEFTISVVEEMMGQHRPPKKVARKRRSATQIAQDRTTTPVPFTPPTQDVEPEASKCTLEKLPVGKKRNCVFRHQSRTRSGYQCPTCDVGLCPTCFTPYHKERNLL